LRAPTPEQRDVLRARIILLAADGSHVQFHFTPTRASWLNQVEIWFSILQGKSLQSASFHSVAQLRLFDSPTLKDRRKIEYHQLRPIRRWWLKDKSRSRLVPQGARLMPGDIKEHRTHAAHCAELAVAARTPQLRAMLLELSKAPAGVLAIDHQNNISAARSKTSNDTKQCGDYAIKTRIIKYWQKRGIIDDQLALKLRGSVVGCFWSSGLVTGEYVSGEMVPRAHPAPMSRYSASQPE
jgi:DDE superfamily endonuclease